MRQARAILAGILVVGLAGGGFLYAQPGDNKDNTGDDLPDVVAPSEAEAKLTPREMATEGDKMIGEMQGMHRRVLELQGSARKAKDVIKLNCVNERLLAVKKLTNIAEASRNDLTEAISAGDAAGSRHQYTKIKQTHERSTSERDGAEGCIGEEIIFIGPTKITVDGPAIPDDPTDDGDDWFTGSTVDLEAAAYATPNGADL